MKILDVPQSGSVAGVTSSRNRFGQYRRTRAIPTNPQTPRQAAVRARLAGLAEDWQGLAPNVQAEWVVWSGMHPRHDSLGQTYTMTGLQAYISINAVLLQAGQAKTEAPPIGTEVPEGFFTALGSSDGAIEVTTINPTEGDIIMVYGARPTSAGVNYNKDFRFLGTIEHEVSPEFPVDFAGPYQTAWGNIEDGVKVRIGARYVMGGFQSPLEIRTVIFVRPA